MIILKPRIVLTSINTLVESEIYIFRQSFENFQAKN